MMHKYFSQIILVIVLIFVSGVLVSAQTFSAPTSNPSSGNVEAPLDTSTSAQYKRGSLAIGKNSNASSGFILDVVGSLRARGMWSVGDLFVDGDIYSDSIKATTSPNPLCAKADGTIELCVINQQNPTPVTLANTGTPGTYSVTIPDGVDEVTVEIWGPGGAGYHSINTNGTSGPTGCVGASHVFRGVATTFTGSGINMTAQSGQCGYKTGSNSYSGGAGGTASATGSLIKTGSTVTTSGASGGAGTGPQFQPPVEQCQNSQYSMVRGTAGGAGGSGGGASSGGAGGSGGGAGSAGVLSSGDISGCEGNSNYSPSSSSVPKDGAFGGNGSNGAWPGGGGGGAGGRGGMSDINDSFFLCSWSGNGSACNGTKGYPGGGGGGYAKATLTNLSGNTFTFTVGSAYRNDEIKTCVDGNYYGCSSSVKSGWGAHGGVRVIYIQ